MKTASGMSSTLGPDSIGFGSGFKGGEGDGRRSIPLNAASGALGNRFAQPSNAGFGLLGGLFGNSPFGLLGGLLGNRPFGIIGADGARTGILADMFNGGGRAASGDTFQGGLLSALLNTAGVRPAGYRDRQMQPKMTEEQVRAQMSNAPSVMAPSPASTPSTAYRPAATPSPMYAPRGRPAPMSASPEYFSPGAPAPAAMTTAPMQPTQFGGQVAEPRPYVDVGMSDLGTVRPAVSRAYVPPMMGFTPDVSTLSTPRPAGMGLGPDANRAAAVRNFVDMQRRALQAQGLLGR